MEIDIIDVMLQGFRGIYNNNVIRSIRTLCNGLYKKYLRKGGFRNDK